MRNLYVVAGILLALAFNAMGDHSNAWETMFWLVSGTWVYCTAYKMEVKR